MNQLFPEYMSEALSLQHTYHLSQPSLLENVPRTLGTLPSYLVWSLRWPADCFVCCEPHSGQYST